MKYFDEYVFNYDMQDPDINYKYYHSYRVMDIMEKLAIKLNLPKKDIELAKIIGLLHDIGRFEQDKLYNSFKDNKMDHGDYGIEVLNKTNIIKNTNIDSSDYIVVYKAIKNHNKFEIQENLSERELLFSKLIRDADRIDILRVLSFNKNIVSIDYDIKFGTNISTDNYYAMLEIMEHLIKEHSVKKVNFIGGPINSSDTEKRLSGCKKVLEENNIELDNNRIYYGDFLADSGSSAIDYFQSKNLKTIKIFL